RNNRTMSTKPHPFRQLRWEDISLDYVDSLVQAASDEDRMGFGLNQPPQHTGDLTTAAVIDEGGLGGARIVARKPMIVCGLHLIPRILAIYGGGCTLHTHCRDGDALEK